MARAASSRAASAKPVAASENKENKVNGTAGTCYIIHQQLSHSSLTRRPGTRPSRAKATEPAPVTNGTAVNGAATEAPAKRTSRHVPTKALRADKLPAAGRARASKTATPAPAPAPAKKMAKRKKDEESDIEEEVAEPEAKKPKVDAPKAAPKSAKPAVDPSKPVPRGPRRVRGKKTEINARAAPASSVSARRRRPSTSSARATTRH
jgi:regulator of chromosome condensation